MANKIKSLDVLAFGAHPDDVEIGAGGIIHQWVKLGKTVGICDLTRGELSSNGTVERREQEARKAGEILGISCRLQLGLPDRGLKIEKAQLDAIARVIRMYRPSIVLIPHHQDRHPDHVQCNKMVIEAAFNGKIRKYPLFDDDGQELPAHNVKNIFTYFINSTAQPAFYIDISEEMEQKMAALQAYQSQFEKKAGAVSTPLTEGYLERVRSREYIFGQEIGVAYAEGFGHVTPLQLKGNFPWI